MTIGIYKPELKVLFNSKDSNTVFSNIEVVNFCKLLSKNNKVCLYSKNDLSRKNRIADRSSSFDISDLSVFIVIQGKLYDKIKEFNNKTYQEEKVLERSRLKLLLDECKCKKYEIEVDLKMTERNRNFFRGINITKLTQNTNSKNYTEFEKLYLFNKKIDYNINAKENKLIYIGNDRAGNRNDKIMEYFIDIDYPAFIFGNFNNPDIKHSPRYKGTLKYFLVDEVLKLSKYSVFISDYSYRKAGFFSPRYWEGLLNGVIMFLDYDTIKNIKYFKKNDWRIVKDNKDLLRKILTLERDRDLYLKLLEYQNQEIKKNFLNGKYLLNKFNKMLKNAK